MLAADPDRSSLLVLPPTLQIIMVRLQRVTFLALHNYLGLTNELFSHVSWIQAQEGMGTQCGGGGHLDINYSLLPYFRRSSPYACSPALASQPAPALFVVLNGESAPRVPRKPRRRPLDAPLTPPEPHCLDPQVPERLLPPLCS